MKTIHQFTDKGDDNLQFLDVKYLAEKEAKLRKYCTQAIRDYRVWQSAQPEDHEGRESAYHGLEGEMLRHNLENAIAAYWFVRRSFRQGFQDYLTQSCSESYPRSGMLSAQIKKAA
ncbi:MAG: hypothetical protein MRY79_09355 [Alphaproteobacteria bacterium]|nr:hypothetical protein [Alphaproteobacteria bacterium]